MSRRTRVTVWVCVLALCASGAAVFFQKEIRITYHRNRMFAAGVNYTLLDNRGQQRTLHAFLKSSVFRMSAYKEGEAMFQHENALIKLGYLEKQEFTFTKRYPSGEGGSWRAFNQQVTNTFDASHWWSCLYQATNKIAVTATPEDMRRWEKLISDFDR